MSGGVAGSTTPLNPKLPLRSYLPTFGCTGGQKPPGCSGVMCRGSYVWFLMSKLVVNPRGEKKGTTYSPMMLTSLSIGFYKHN